MLFMTILSELLLSKEALNMIIQKYFFTWAFTTIRNVGVHLWANMSIEKLTDSVSQFTFY